MRLFAAAALALAGEGSARAQDDVAEEAPAPHDDLAERQRKLEERVEADENAPPLAGYSERNFFLRDPNDWFVLIPKGRLNVDYNWFASRPKDPPGGVIDAPADTRPKDGVFIRRARWGIAGTIARHIDFRIEAEFANVPAQGQYASLTDASVVLDYTPIALLEAGQFYTPFTLENPTSENYTDFMEKGAATRFAVPTARETGVMLFGETPHSVARYWIGLFDGEGQNVKNLDYGAAVIGRTIFAPLALLREHAAWQEQIWIGGSAWFQRTQNLGGTAAASTTGATQGDISGFTTQSGLPVFASNYTNGAVRSHLAPSGTTTKWALELNAPLFERAGLRAEYNHQKMEVSEYDDSATGRTPGTAAALRGSGEYIEAWVWLGEKVNVDSPGLYQTPHWRGYKKAGPPTTGVMVAAKYEHVGLTVDGLAPKDPAQGSYSLDVFELGGSLWVTRHSRFIANWIVNWIGGANDASSGEQKNPFFRKTDHELAFRIAVSL